jgi:hypothetical protein
MGPRRVEPLDATEASALAARALLLGTFSLLALGLFAPYALVVARRARRTILASPDATDVGMATAGVVLATIGCVWLAVWICFVLVLVITG